MGCTNSTTLSNITFTCSDKPKGGLDDLIVLRKSDIDFSAETDPATDVDGELDLSPANALAGGAVAARIDFNKKDGFSYAGTEYSGEADGTDSFTPTIAVQLPRVDNAKLEAIKDMVGGFNELVAFVKARTGERFAFGIDNGVYGSSATTTTGNNTEKNMIELTFTGDEDSFERTLSQVSWDAVEALVA
jgi:hypothetical protein